MKTVLKIIVALVILIIIFGAANIKNFLSSSVDTIDRGVNTIKQHVDIPNIDKIINETKTNNNK